MVPPMNFKMRFYFTLEYNKQFGSIRNVRCGHDNNMMFRLGIHKCIKESIKKM